MDWQQALAELERGNAVYRADWAETMEYLDARFAGAAADEATHPYVAENGSRFHIVKMDDAEPERNVDPYTPSEEDKAARWELC